MPRLRLLRRPVHGQQHELHDRGAGPGAARQRHDPGGGQPPAAPGQAGRHAHRGADPAGRQAARHPDPGRLRERHRRGHGHRRLEQHGRCTCWPSPTTPAFELELELFDQISRRTPVPDEAEPVRRAPHGRPGRGGRHPGGDERAGQARPAAPGPADGDRQDGGRERQAAPRSCGAT